MTHLTKEVVEVFDAIAAEGSQAIGRRYFWTYDSRIPHSVMFRVDAEKWTYSRMVSVTEAHYIAEVRAMVDREVEYLKAHWGNRG